MTKLAKVLPKGSDNLPEGWISPMVPDAKSKL
jgi:hypothetical protein